VSVRFERLSGRFPRWVVGNQADIDRVVQGRGCTLLYDAKGNPLVLFEDDWALRWTLERETALTFLETAP
jgi:peptide chain release factor 3